MRITKIATALVAAAAALAVQVGGSSNALACGTNLPLNFALVTDHPQAFSNGQSYIDEAAGLELVMQADGNLVLYYTPDMKALWASNTVGRGSFFQFQSDGNAVIYDKSNHPVFSTHTNSTVDGSNRELTLDLSGHLVVETKAGAILYRSGSTMPDNVYSLVGVDPDYGFGFPNLTMQSDGNLVVYSAGKAIWNTHTNGHPGAYAAELKNLDLVVDYHGANIFSTGTAPTSCAVTCAFTPFLTVLSNGDVRIYAEPGDFLLWSSVYGHTPDALTVNRSRTAGSRPLKTAPSDCCC